jgi:hypothetical protein
MLNNPSLRNLILIWMAWAVIIIGFQMLVDSRMQPARPDYAVEWTVEWTLEDSQDGNIYLTEPFMNNQVSMDSEYYLSIATGGYDDPDARTVRTRSGRAISLNYAFFPLYPLVSGAVATPLRALNLTPIAASTLAGVLVSLVGTLAGMIALYDLTRKELEESGGLRTAYYLLIFPTAFFLAQVYTEGLFVGLAFGCLALARRRQILLAGVLGALAVWTRSLGLALVIPLALAWLGTVDWQRLRNRAPASAAVPIVEGQGGAVAVMERKLGGDVLRLVISGLAVLLPIAAFLLWRQAFGRNFDLVQDLWFGRTLFDFGRMFSGWDFAFKAIISGEILQMRVYYLLELASIILALVACLFTLRRYPGVALFGLAALVIAVTSGAPQSLVRYMLAVPSIYIFLSHLGRYTAFDRAWTLFSILLLGMQTALFTWDMWVA